MKNYQFSLTIFGNEILRMLAEGHSLPIEDTCESIDDHHIAEYVQTSFGFKNINMNEDIKDDINELLASKYVSENEARNWGLEGNGLAYIAHLLWEDLLVCMGNMKLNDISPEDYRE